MTKKFEQEDESQVTSSEGQIVLEFIMHLPQNFPRVSSSMENLLTVSEQQSTGPTKTHT